MGKKIKTEKMKYLIFDFDGVIADTLKANLQARINLGRVKTMEEAILQMNLYFDNKPLHTKNHTLSKDDLAKLTDRIISMGKEIHRLGFNLFEDFVKEIKQIADKKLAIVSTGTQVYVKDKAMSSGLNPTHILTYEDHHSKEKKIEKICKDWGVGINDVYYFTDSKADVYELENFLDREKIIGVSWGYCGYDKLRELLPEKQILREFDGIHKIIS